MLECKTKAKELINNHIWDLLMPTILMTVISMILGYSIKGSIKINMGLNFSSIDYKNILALIILLPMSVGYSKYIMNFIHKKEYGFNNLFFEYKNIIVILLSLIIISILESLGYILLIIPGIILSIAFSLTNFLLAEDNVTDPIVVITNSYNLTKGYKEELFFFYLSFIPWFLLSIITFGFALIYVLPYFKVSQALVYDKLKNIK